MTNLTSLPVLGATPTAASTVTEQDLAAAHGATPTFDALVTGSASASTTIAASDTVGSGEGLVTFPTGTAAPTLSVDAAGVPHVTIPLTKKTKAHIGTTIAGITVAGEFALSFLLPTDSVETTVVKAVVAIGGLAATFLGIVLPTNLPKKA